MKLIFYWAMAKSGPVPGPKKVDHRKVPRVGTIWWPVDSSDPGDFKNMWFVSVGPVVGEKLTFQILGLFPISDRNPYRNGLLVYIFKTHRSWVKNVKFPDAGPIIKKMCWIRFVEPIALPPAAPGRPPYGPCALRYRQNSVDSPEAGESNLKFFLE